MFPYLHSISFRELRTQLLLYNITFIMTFPASVAEMLARMNRDLQGSLSFTHRHPNLETINQPEWYRMGVFPQTCCLVSSFGV